MLPSAHPARPPPDEYSAGRHREQETHLQCFPELETLEGCPRGCAGRRYLVVESPVPGIAEPCISAIQVLWTLLALMLQHAGEHLVHYGVDNTCGAGVLTPS